MDTNARDVGVPSEATDLVVAAMPSAPSPEAGGPCATCAFRSGTEAHQADYTYALARLCVEGGVPFYCHEQEQLCRGFIAAVNVRGVPANEDERRWAEVARMGADVLGRCIDAAKAAESLQEA